MRRTHLATLVALAAVATPVGVLASSASAAVSTSSSKYFLQGGTSPVKNVKVSGYDGKTVYVAVSAVGNVVAVSNTTDVALPFGYTSYAGTSIAFTGTQDAVNAALASLTVTVPELAAGPVSVQVTAFAQQAGLAYNPANQHFYRYVPYATGTATANKTGDKAFAAAASTTELGLSGYLASVTSADENSFVSSKLQNPTTGAPAQNVWLGGSDSAAEGTWNWVGGPDNGTTFWVGCAADSPLNPGVAKGYANWNPDGEPNNWNTALNKGCSAPGYVVPTNPADGENCMVTNWTASYVPVKYRVGYWNDLPCNQGQSATEGYVLEFGNKPEGGDFTGVDFVTSSMTVAVPAPKPTFLDTLFNLFGFNKKTLKKSAKVRVVKPKTKTAPAKVVTCPATFRKARFSYTLLFSEAGRYSFYFTNAQGRRIPMECGTKIKTRVITEAISAPVIQSVKDGEKPSIVAYLKASSALTGDVDYPVLNVILKRPDGTLVRQDQPNPPLPGTPIK